MNSDIENQLTQEGLAQLSLWQKTLSDLPEKALRFGIRLVIAILALLIGAWIIKIIRKILKKALTKAGADPSVRGFIDSFTKFLLYFVLIFGIAVKLGFDTASVVAILGSAGVAIGLALQGSLSNLAGGVLLLILRPFKTGDYIRENKTGTEGTVEDISLFYTKLLTVDNKMVILPNGDLANTSMTNFTAQKVRRVDLKVSIHYSADLKKAKVIAENLLAKNPLVLTDREYFVFVDELADSGVILGIRFWVKTPDYWAARFAVLEEVKLVFDENEIQIPFPQMDVHIIPTCQNEGESI